MNHSATMTRLYLIRHGETDWNRSGRIMGTQPVPLNANGRRQVVELAAVLADLHKTQPLAALYTSPLVRTVQTAEILASSCSLSITLDERLREIGVGDWEGRYWRDLDQEPIRSQWYSHPHEARFPNGETLGEVQARALPAAAEALDRHPGGAIALISHGDVLRTILAHYLGAGLEPMRRLRFDHASLTALHLVDGFWVISCVNYRHAPGDLL
jgi:broad specificity phosphatase PhoE